MNLFVLARGAVHTAEPASLARNSPSFFADPAAWVVMAAVDDALGSGDQLCTPRSTAVVAISATCSSVTMAAIAVTTARGRVSPLRFAGSSPGILAGLPCIRRGLRGPSLTLTMTPAAGLGPALVVVRGWLAGPATEVLLITHTLDEQGHSARCALVRSAAGIENPDGTGPAYGARPDDDLTGFLAGRPGARTEPA